MEEQTKRMALLSVAALVVVGIVIGIVLYVLSQKTVEPAAQQAPVPQNEVSNIVAPEKSDLAAPKLTARVSDTKEAQLKRFCIDFLARFGTYSTDGASMNLVQLMPLMTGELKVWAEGRLEQKSVAEKFSGVVTKALAAKIVSQSSSAAIVEVSSQRTYTENNQQRVTYEDATLTLVNDGGWRVESVSWKARAE
jgi:hypothetical protein